jgi:hypothetical protein
MVKEGANYHTRNKKLNGVKSFSERQLKPPRAHQLRRFRSLVARILHFILARSVTRYVTKPTALDP